MQLWKSYTTENLYPTNFIKIIMLRLVFINFIYITFIYDNYFESFYSFIDLWICVKGTRQIKSSTV